MLFAAFMTVATLVLLASCAPADTDISERRTDYFTASDEMFTVTAVSGMRETPYETDGVVAKMISYTLITVSPTDKAVFDVTATCEYEASVPDDPDRSGESSGKKFGGALIVHPFAASYSAEFAYETTDTFTVAVLYTENGEKRRREYKMTSLVTPEMMTYDSAVSAAKNEFDINGAHETRVRLINNPVSEGLCWYVVFYFADGKNCGVLLDPTTAKVLAKRSDRNE